MYMMIVKIVRMIKKMKVKVLQEIKEDTVHFLSIAYKWGCPELHGEGIDIETIRRYPSGTITRELINLDDTEMKRLIALWEA